MELSVTQREKESLRVSMRSRLKSIPVEIRRELSARASTLLEEQPAWHRASAVLGYLPLKDELDLERALVQGQAVGKIVAIPRYVPQENSYCAAVLPRELSTLAKALFGVREPGLDSPVVPLKQLDFILVPGLAFDSCGRRLGRGKGFYDRLLAQVEGIKCGVALDEQIVEELPAESHDIAMNLILTPTRWLLVPPARS